MGACFLYGNGGSIDNLKFCVYSATSLPSSGKENDVCIITSTPIPCWEVGAVDNPTWSMDDGFVYLTCDSSDASQPNLLRKNALYLKLMRCWQYGKGTWSTKDAYQYRNGAWVQFSSTIVYLYNKGDLCTDITGGWKATAWPFASNEYGRAPTVDYKDTYVNLSINGGGNNYCGVFEPINKIDLTGVKTILFKLNSVSSTSTQYTLVTVGVFKRGQPHYEQLSRYAPELNTTDVSAAVDVSNLSGLQNVGVYIRAFETVNVALSEIQLIR